MDEWGVRILNRLGESPPKKRGAVNNPITPRIVLIWSILSIT
jgi:hypothetical protein